MREQQIALARIMVPKEKCRYDKEKYLTTYVGKRERDRRIRHQVDNIQQSLYNRKSLNSSYL